MEIQSTTSGQILAGNLSEKANASPNNAVLTGKVDESSNTNPNPTKNTATEINLAEVEDAISTLEPVNRDLSFQIDKKSDTTIVSVVDSQSGDVIRQIPSEEFIKIAEKIKDMAENSELRSGILFNSEV